MGPSSWLQELGLSSNLSEPQFLLCQLKILKIECTGVLGGPREKEGTGKRLGYCLARSRGSTLVSHYFCCTLFPL